MTIKSAPHFACDLQDHLINAAFADNVLDVDAVGDMLTDEIAELAEDFLGDLAPEILGKYCETILMPKSGTTVSTCRLAPLFLQRSTTRGA
jgi:hypothetical protein